MAGSDDLGSRQGDTSATEGHGRVELIAVDTILPILAICVGGAIIAGRNYFVRSDEATRTSWTGKREKSGRPRLRRAYDQTIPIIVGAMFIAFGGLDLAGVASLTSPKRMTVGPTFVVIFLIVFVLVAITMAVRFFRSRK